VVFEVELALEGVVDRFDDLAQWFEERARIVLLALAGGRSRSMPVAARVASKSPAEVVLSAISVCPAGVRPGGIVEDVQQHGPSSALAPVNAGPDGSPLRVQAGAAAGPRVRV